MNKIQERRKARYSKRKIQSNDDLYKSNDPSVSIDSPVIGDVETKSPIIEKTAKKQRKRS